MKTLSIKNLLNEKLSKLYFEIKNNQELILKDSSDIEYLHDLRVAVRKTRAIFTLLDKYFLYEPLKDCQKRFKYIGKLTNAPRDLDVYLETLNNFSQSLSSSDQNKLYRLVSILQKQRDEEYIKLISFISSKKFTKMLNKFLLFAQGDCNTSLCHNSAKSVAKENLSELYQSIVEDCDTLTLTSSNEDFHKLRIEFKKLRYIIELFLPIYKNKKSTVLLSKLKALQTKLGNFNDLDVQLNTLDLFITKYDLDVKEQEIIKTLQLKFLKEQQEIKGKLIGSFTPILSDDFKELLFSCR